MISIETATSEDLPDILELQKRAFGPIAELCGNNHIAPMTETPEEIRRKWEKGIILKAVVNQTLLGSVRGYLTDDYTCHIGRLIVDPIVQQGGIGRRLMAEIEERFPLAKKFSIFTGTITPHTAKLYESIGYRTTNKKTLDGIEMVYMEKPNRLTTQEDSRAPKA